MTLRRNRRKDTAACGQWHPSYAALRCQRLKGHTGSHFCDGHYWLNN